MDTALVDVFSTRLRETRGDMMQSTFAQIIGVSRASLSSYENGTRIPDIETLKRIHVETGVSIYYLLGLTDSRDDTFATAQRDTGLSEKALEHFSANPISAKVINHLVEHGAMQEFTAIAATLHDDEFMYRGVPDGVWSPAMEAMRLSDIERLGADMLQILDESLRCPDQCYWGITKKQLPCSAIFTTLEHLTQAQKGLELLSQSPDDEYAQRAKQYAESVKAMTTINVEMIEKALNRILEHGKPTKGQIRDYLMKVVNTNAQETPEQ